MSGASVASSKPARVLPQRRRSRPRLGTWAARDRVLERRRILASIRRSGLAARDAARSARTLLSPCPSPSRLSSVSRSAPPSRGSPPPSSRATTGPSSRRVRSRSSRRSRASCGCPSSATSSRSTATGRTSTSCPGGACRAPSTSGSCSSPGRGRRRLLARGRARAQAPLRSRRGAIVGPTASRSPA